MLRFFFLQMICHACFFEFLNKFGRKSAKTDVNRSEKTDKKAGFCKKILTALFSAVSIEYRILFFLESISQ